MDSGPDTAVKSSSDLPPTRKRKGLRPVSPPLSNISLHRLNYYIGFLAVIFLAIYAYRILRWKAEAGSWWNLTLGNRPPPIQDEGMRWDARHGNVPDGGASGSSGDVERKINELAAVLGLPSKDLASAIAVAVREYVPPASLSSIAAHQTGYARSVLHSSSSKLILL